jgi:hypothetical protein
MVVKIIKCFGENYKMARKIKWWERGMKIGGKS